MSSFSEVLGPGQGSVFEEEMGLDLVVFKGVTARTKDCHIRLLDLRGFHLSKHLLQLCLKPYALYVKSPVKVLAQNFFLTILFFTILITKLLPVHNQQSILARSMT